MHWVSEPVDRGPEQVDKTRHTTVWVVYTFPVAVTASSNLLFTAVSNPESLAMRGRRGVVVLSGSEVSVHHRLEPLVLGEDELLLETLGRVDVAPDEVGHPVAPQHHP
ncbi:hypothetical protein OPV22_024106 [Ensete ventricosum]|uniref:Uncharacterized protein n=1 Tax=Ensete ventricosum TaxID=4639 RepID=A0AAV8QJL4_ENSVE|nr:hypothetical protein OPV22_024106 [Ensete ventricosum]